MPDEKPDKPAVVADPEVAALAEAIGGEGFDPLKVEGEAAPSQEKPASEGQEETPASEEKVEPKEGEEKPAEDGGEGGDQEAPLKDLAGDKGALKVLLEHPILGPLLNGWADRAGNAQVATALKDARPTIEADAKRGEVERIEDEHFSSMSKEQIAEEISGDEEAATAYARHQVRKAAGGQPNAEAIVQTSQLYSYASRVSAVQSLLKESELSDEVKESLKPEHFTHLKAEGIRVWEQAVFQAVVDHTAQGLSETQLAEKWEAYKEEHLAEIDGPRPALVDGRRDGPKSDLMGTDSSTILEQGLAAKEAERAKTK